MSDMIPALAEWPHQFAAGDSVFHEDYGHSFRFEVKEILHKKDGSIRLVVVVPSTGLLEIADESQLSFASSSS
jgi:hypothetical protein